MALSTIPLVGLSEVDGVAATPTTFVVGTSSEVPAGETFHGARVTAVDPPLRFLTVEASDPVTFETLARADPRVRYVERDIEAEIAWTPNDPLLAKQGWARINAPAAWDVTRGSPSVLVAVIDTGIDRSHPDLASARFLPGWDFVNHDADPNDDCGHGTAVAGILGATSGNGLGVAGAADVSILPLKAIGRTSSGSCLGPFSAVASAIRHAADEGADVITMSLGCPGCYHQATSEAIRYAWSKGALLVASAGNSGPCSDCVSWPGAHADVVAVGCTDTSNAVCYFSSSGAEVELVAPGKSVTSTIPGGRYAPISGTSIAAPHVAGAAALALSATPTLSNADLRARLAASARDLGPAGRDAASGFGLLDAGALLPGAASPPAPANVAPTAAFTLEASGLRVDVDGSSSSDPDGTIVSWTWAFGDGAAASGRTATHTYGASGRYTVSLTVTDNAGATHAASRTVDAVAPNVPPTAHARVVSTGLTVSADGTGSSDPDGSIVGWAWTFGDGAGASGPTPSHTYASPGTYTVALTVTDDRGGTATTSTGVTVERPPPAPQGDPIAHVGSIVGSADAQRLTWNVVVLDTVGNGVPTAATWVRITGPSTSTIRAAYTASDGLAQVTFDASAPGTWKACIVVVSKSGWTYDSAANAKTCESIVR